MHQPGPEVSLSLYLLGFAVLAVTQALIKVVEPQVRSLDFLVSIDTGYKSFAVLTISQERSCNFWVKPFFVELLKDDFGDLTACREEL